MRFRRPAPKNVRNGLRSISASSGFDRGTPIDRKLISDFLKKEVSLLESRFTNSAECNVLEVGEIKYAKEFFPKANLSALLPPVELFQQERFFANTIFVDLDIQHAEFEFKYDVIIATHVLNFLQNPVAAVQNIQKLLEFGGCALVTVASTHPISNYDESRWGDYLRYMPQGFLKLIGEVVDCEIQSFSVLGNTGLVIARHMGLSAEEMKQELFENHDYHDPLVLGAVLVRKPL